MLTFGNVQTTDIPYKQFHVRVVVDSQQANAHSTGIKPKRTPESEREEKRSSSMKTGQTRGVAPSLTIGLIPQGKIGGSSTWTNEEATGSEKKRYTSRITQQELYGVIWWGFNIDDLNEQEDGIDMLHDVLPAVHFEFIGDSDVPAPPPERMDIVIASYWSMIPRSEPKSTWIQKLLRLTRSFGNNQAISYSNLFQIVALETDPSNLPERSHYSADVQVWPGATDPQHTYLVDVKRPTASSVNVKPAVVVGKYIPTLTCGLEFDNQNIFR
jgi:hypothetical protein